jgi:DNA-binding HxlR family transcriptional regulator
MTDTITLDDLRTTVTEAKTDIAKTLRAIAHPKRLEILAALVDNTKSFVTLLDTTQVSRTALANHLSQLVGRGLVNRVERGAYQVTADGRELLHAVVEAYIDSQVRITNGRRRFMERYVGTRRSRSRMKKLDNFVFQNRWVSHLGCLESCGQFLGLEISSSWWYGATGHAFILNIAQDVCPSGPTAWRPTIVYEGAQNLGCKIEGVFKPKGDAQYEEAKAQVWSFVRKTIDARHPVYGWQIGDIADYYLIYGYDETGYYYKGYFQEEGAGPKPWKEIGQMMLDVMSVQRVHPQSDGVVVKQALEKVLKHAQNPPEWIFTGQGYRSGLEGYEQWIAALEQGTAVQFGNSYNAQVWTECRQHAVGFLQEAQTRVKGKAKTYFAKAIAQYQQVAEHLGKVAELYPFQKDELTMDPIKVDATSRQAAEQLRAAREAEADGLQALEKIAETL